MTPHDFLELEISLILLRYGRQEFLRAVAHRMQFSDDALRLELDKMLCKEYVPRSKSKSIQKPFTLDTLLVGREDKADYLRQLCARFDNRTFLPELKDVKRFFERNKGDVPTLKSRTLAQASLFQLIADLDISVIKKLLDETPAGSEVSSLGMISGEILGRNELGTKNRKS